MNPFQRSAAALSCGVLALLLLSGTTARHLLLHELCPGVAGKFKSERRQDVWSLSCSSA